MVVRKTGDVNFSGFGIYPFPKSLKIFFVDGRNEKCSVVDPMHPSRLPFLKAVMF